MGVAFFIISLCCVISFYSDDGKFKRIPVFRGPGGGFGFAAPFEFDSLLTLVLYYSVNTLEKHNPGLLRAALKIPACPRR